MSGSTNFLPFDPNAVYMQSDADYLASTYRLSGVTDGIALPSTHNKLFYQTSGMAFAIATVLANAGAIITDNNLGGIETALQNIFGTIGTVTAKSADYTALQADHGVLLEYTGTHTLALTAAATLGAGWFCWVVNSGTGYITIDPNGSELCDGYIQQFLGPNNKCLLFCDGTGFYTFGRKAERIILEDQKTSGTNGGTSTSGSWLTRDMNTIVKDTTGQVVVGSNQFTLPPGEYDIDGFCYLQGPSIHRIKLYNTTDTADVIVGLSDYSNNATGIGSKPTVKGAFSIAVQKTFEIRYKCGTGVATIGLGQASSYGTEVYTHVELRRL